MSVQFWALPRTGPDLFLPDRGDYTISDGGGTFGSIDLSYPSTGRNFEVLAALDLDDVPVEIEARISGSSADALGFVLLNSDGDTTRTGMWKFTGRDLAHLLCSAKLLHGSGENGNTEITGTAGVIIRTLMQDAQARGLLLDIDFSSFTNDRDSNGVPWANEVGVSLSPGQDYPTVFGVLQSYDACEWELTSRRELRVYNPGTRGVDRTLPGQQVTLERGRDQEDAPVRRSLLDVGTRVQAYGSDGLRSFATNAAAEARLGYPIEVFRSFNNVADQGTLDALTQATAEAIGDGAREQSHALNIGPGTPRPGRDFHVGDWVLSGARGSVRRLRTAQFTMSEEGGSERAAVTLGDLIDERDVRLARKIEAITNGSVVVGTSQPSPDTDDGRHPAAPTGLVGTSLAYLDEDGGAHAQVTASWAAVTENEDGTAIGDLGGYAVQYRLLGGVEPTLWVNGALVRAGQTVVTMSPLLVGEPIELRVAAYDRYDRLSAWSLSEFLTTATDTTAPGVPSAGEASNYIGIFAVRWDGLTEDGIPIRDTDPGFDHVNIYVDPAAAFDPIAGQGTLIGSMRTAGTFGYDQGTPGVELFVRLTSVDRSGNESAASLPTSATPGLVEEGDVGSVNIGSLTAGILRALMIVADGQIATSEGPDGVKIDNDGLRCLTPAGVPVLAFSIATGLLELVGKFSTAEPGIGGARIEIDPEGPDGNPTMSLFSDNGLFGAARLNAFDKAGGQTGLGINSGSSDATSNASYSRVLLDPVFAELKIGAAANQGDAGGVARLTLGQAALFLTDAGGTVLGKLLIGDDGTVLLGSSGDAYIRHRADGYTAVSSSSGQMIMDDGDIRFTRAVGTSGAGFSFLIQGLSNGGYRPAFDSGGNVIRFVDNDSNTYVGDGNGGLKTFVIPHPGDSDRWLVHGCTEGPSAGVEYHGVAEVVDHAAVVELPSYFEAATQAEGRQVQVSVLVDHERADRPSVPAGPPTLGPASPDRAGALDLGEPGLPPVPEWAELPRVAASLPTGGRFRITCSAPRARVAWRVFAVRADIEPFDVEPLRADVDVRGDGPYRHLTPRHAA